VSQFKILDLPTFSDARGMLSVIDGLLPFPMQRIYWIHGADAIIRGGHRHRQTRQALVAIHGQVTIHMDDGKHAVDVRLDSPARCLIVEPEDWHTMHFGPGAVLLVIASRTYDVNDYVDEPYPR
jgi:hypothetical protein